MHLIVPLLLTLAPGRYLAETPAGERVELVLHADGRALFGGAACAWEQSAGALRLGAHVLKEDGGCHVGPPFGRLCFSPAPLTVPRDPAPPPAPAPLVGEWVFSGSGGELVLALGAGGAYEMRQPGLVTRGRWRGGDGSLVLVPDGGGPIRYRARRGGADLLVAGGDLPSEVRFRPRRSGRYTPPD